MCGLAGTQKSRHKLGSVAGGPRAWTDITGGPEESDLRHPPRLQRRGGSWTGLPLDVHQSVSLLFVSDKHIPVLAAVPGQDGTEPGRGETRPQVLCVGVGGGPGGESHAVSRGRGGGEMAC